jgi:amidohydrolase
LINEKEIERIYPSMVEFRRHIHEFPELGMETTKTRDFVEKHADSLGFSSRRIENGLTVDTGNSPRVALRADMDALPIEENTGLPFSSKNRGIMHACGHDMHTAILMGVMEYLSRADLAPVRLIFQPGEEIGKGASMMISGGAIDGIEYTFGLHAWPSLGVGEYAILKGKAMAAVDEFTVRITGQGGHGAYPHLAYDTILESSRVVQYLLTIPARRVNPLNPSVLSIGYIKGGSARNIIPTDVEIGGTVRTFSTDDSKIIEREVMKIAGEHVAVDYSRELPPLINDATYASSIDEISSKYVKMVNPDPTMGGEDFSLYCSGSKCSFAFLGTGKVNGKEVSKHSSVFTVNEEAMKYGMKLHISAVLAALKMQ